MIVLKLLHEILLLFLQMAPYLVLGMGIAGVLSQTMKASFISRHIGNASLGSVLKASLFGVPLPLCSCSVVPTALFLRDSGASTPAVTGFLISTPQTGVDSIAATYGMMGPLMALYRPLSAFLLGTIGGIVSLIVPAARTADPSGSEGPAQPAEEHSCTCSSCHTDTHGAQAPAGHPSLFRAVLKFLSDAFRYGFLDFIDDIGKHFLIGLAIAGLLSVSIPEGFFAGSVFGSGIIGMLSMVAVGIPIYICSTSSIPIAVLLIAKGASLGTAFVFLLAGPATNIATLLVLSKKMGRRYAVQYVTVLVIGSLVFGLLLDRLIAVFPQLDTFVFSAGASDAQELISFWSVTTSVLLLGLIIRSFRPRHPHVEHTL